MNPQHHMRFAARPLSAAILMALATPAAFAAVTATQLPGVGYVVNGNVATATPDTTTNTLTIKETAAAPVVIQWGGSAPAGVTATLNKSGTAGFNIGSSATVKFAASATADTSPILNIDATGNPSMILGTMTAGTNFSSPVYVANANGIVVGAGSVIDLPNGLGLINADETSSQAQAVFTQAGSPVAISFQGATGGVTISAGADLANVGTARGGFLLVAGAGNVNVAGAFVSNAGVTAYAINDATAVTVDAGVGGYLFRGTSFVPQDKGTAQTFGSLSTANYNSTFSYQDAANSAANLNLGITTSPYDASNLAVLVDGNINLASGSDLTNVQNPSPTADVAKIFTFDWSGMLTNNGVMDYGDQTGTTLTPTTASADIIANGLSKGFDYAKIYANTTTAQYGGFDNATSGLVNAGDIYASGSSFSNAGTLQMGQSGTITPSLGVMATSGNINIGGTVSVVSATSAYSGPLFLSDLALVAASTAGQSVTVDTSPLLVSDSSSYAAIDATNVNLDSSLTVSGRSLTVSGRDFVFVPYSVDNASAAPVSGSFVLASGATLSATLLYLGTESWNSGPAYTSYKINGSMVATGTAASDGAFLGGTYAGGHKASVFNVSGAGSITAGNLTFKNLLGSVNNITTGQILANGFRVNAPTVNGQPGTVNITVTAVGAAPQGFNVFIVGNATINSGDTVAVNTQAPAGNEKYAQYLYPANANSNLVVSANGSLTVNAGTGADNYGLGTALFQWPGLVYMVAGSGDLTATAAIANAYGAQAATGHAGVFFIANNITDSFPIYTNGNAGVVFAAPPLTGVLWAHLQAYYPYALSINGVNPFTGNPGLPTVYFATPNPTVANANFSFQVLNSFTNGRGYQQENQTFLTLP